jgi:hypothetical protein
MRTKWGPWTFDVTNRTLHYPVTPYYRYEVDLDTMTSTGEVLDWIAQITEKEWPRLTTRPRESIVLNDAPEGGEMILLHAAADVPLSVREPDPEMAAVIGYFVMALNDLLGLQQHYCGCGANRSGVRPRQLIR